MWPPLAAMTRFNWGRKLLHTFLTDWVLPHGRPWAVDRSLKLICVTVPVLTSLSLNMSPHTEIEGVQIWQLWRPKVFGPDGCSSRLSRRFGSLESGAWERLRLFPPILLTTLDTEIFLFCASLVLFWVGSFSKAFLMVPNLRSSWPLMIFEGLWVLQMLGNPIDTVILLTYNCFEMSVCLWHTRNKADTSILFASITLLIKFTNFLWIKIVFVIHWHWLHVHKCEL